MSCSVSTVLSSLLVWLPLTRSQCGKGIVISKSFIKTFGRYTETSMGSQISSLPSQKLKSLVSVCVCVCVCVHVYVVYEDTNLYNDMGMT